MYNNAHKLTVNWNIDTIFLTREDWCKELANIDDKITQFDSILDCIEYPIIRLLDMDNEIRPTVNKIHTYAYLKYLNNTSNLQVSNDLHTAEDLLNCYELKVSSVLDNIIENIYEISDVKLKEMDKSIYRYAITQISANTTVENKISLEQALDHISPPLSRIVDIYNTLYETFEENNYIIWQNQKKINVSHNEYVRKMSSNISRSKKVEFEKYYFSRFLKHDEVFKELLLTYIMTSVGIAQIEGYRRAIHYQLYLSDLSQNAYEYTINAASEGYHLCKEYYEMKKKYFGVEYLTVYETEELIGETENTYFSYISIIDKLFDAFDILGEEYRSSMFNFLTTGKVKISDKLSNNQNMTISSYNSDEIYTTLCLKGGAGDQITVAHEIGHAIYAILTNKNQIAVYRDIPTFLHEIPAVLNELIIIDYNISIAKNTNEKMWYLERMIEMYINNYYSSSLFSEFEDEIYGIVENGQLFNTELLNELMNEKMNKIFLNIIEDTSLISRTWIDIKHFYNSYYMFNYASSITYAIIVHNKLKKEKLFYKNYIEFLKCGKSRSNKDLLKLIDINIDDKEIYSTVNNEFKKLVYEYRILQRKLTN